MERTIAGVYWVASVALVTFFLCDNAHSTQVNYTGGNYSQNFNGLPINTNSDPINGSDVSQLVEGRGPHAFSVLSGNLTASGMDGWYFGNPLGSSANTEFRAHNGSRSSSGGRGAISFGHDNNTERALGTLPTSNQISRIGVLLFNAGSETYNSFTVSFQGEQWRLGDRADPNTLSFFYGIGSSIDDESLFSWSPLNFVAPRTANESEFNIPLDGNAVGNFTQLSDTIELTWAPGQTLALRWTTDEASGQDHGLSIDDFVFTAHSSSTCGPGDFNCDGKVDAADFAVWRNNGAEPTDYQTWKSNFGTTWSGSGQGFGGGVAVPEPSAIILLLTSLAVYCVAHRAPHKSFMQT